MKTFPNKMENWNEYAYHVLEALKDAKGERRAIKREIEDLKVSLARLETKVAVRAGTTGAIAGAVLSVIIGVVVALLSR